MKVNLDTYIISDTHFGHNNIIKYCDRPKNHDEIMWDNWNNTVEEEDIVLHLGDLTFKTGYDYDFSNLPGKKYLIKGNHDHRKDSWYEDNGFMIMPERIWFWHNDKTILFTHYPTSDFDVYWNINIHGHIHNNGYVRKEINGFQYINVSVEVMDYAPVKLRNILEVL